MIEYKVTKSFLMQVFHIKHIRSHNEEKCMCIFQVAWLSGPNVGQHVKINFGSIYLPDFHNIENHAILKEAAQFLENHLGRPQKRLRKIIAEDENGFIIIKEVISEH